MALRLHRRDRGPRSRPNDLNPRRGSGRLVTTLETGSDPRLVLEYGDGPVDCGDAGSSRQYRSHRTPVVGQRSRVQGPGVRTPSFPHLLKLSGGNRLQTDIRSTKYTPGVDGSHETGGRTHSLSYGSGWNPTNTPCVAWRQVQGTPTGVSPPMGKGFSRHTPRTVWVLHPVVAYERPSTWDWEHPQSPQ